MLAPLTSDEWSALRLSLLAGVFATMVCLPPGVAIGWLLARRRFPGKALLDAVVHLPLVLPPVAVGYLLLLVLGRNGVLGRGLNLIGVQIAYTWLAVAIASAVMAFPLLVRPIRLAFELVDPGIEAAAATLGARPIRVFFTITLPLALPGLLAGAVLAFARSIGEFGATITFAGDMPGRTRTLPLALYASVQRPGGDAEAIRLVVISLLLSLGALLASELLARRMAGRLGRR
jgi:molybdate transport system permease protein